MTIGSKTLLGPSVRTYQTNVGAGLDVETGYYTTGDNFRKTWNGTDRPLQRRAYTTLTYWLPAFEFVRVRISKKGKFRMKRIRKAPKRHFVRQYADAKRRSHQEDHSYTMDLVKRTSSIYTKKIWEIDSSVFPPVGGRLAYVTHGETFAVYQDGFSIGQNWGANDDIALIGKLREKVAGTSFNMGVFLGEGRKGLKLIEDSAITILTAYRAVKRGDFAGAAFALGVNRRTKEAQSKTRVASSELSARWLELQYGWAPMVQDAYEGAGYLATRLNAPMTQNYRVRRKVNATIIRSGSPFIHAEAEAYTSTQLIARVSEVSEVRLAGLLDPASLVWELLPYSFVFDWFIPIGNYLHARALNSALTGSFVTTKVARSKTSYSGLPDEPSGSPLFSPGTTTAGIFAKVQRITMSRAVSTNLAIPMPGFKKLSDVPSWKRTANAVSLVTQAVIRRRPASG